MVYGFGFARANRDLGIKRYAVSLFWGLILSITSGIFLFFYFKPVFSDVDFQLNKNILDTQYDSTGLHLKKKVSVKISHCYGSFYRRYVSKRYSYDYYIVETDDGSLIAIKTPTTKGTKFEELSKSINNIDLYEHVGLLSHLDKELFDKYYAYIQEMKSKDIIDSNAPIYYIKVDNGAGPEEYFYILFIIIFFLIGVYELILGITEYKKIINPEKLREKKYQEYREEISNMLFKKNNVNEGIGAASELSLTPDRYLTPLQNCYKKLTIL